MNPAHTHAPGAPNLPRSDRGTEAMKKSLSSYVAWHTVAPPLVFLAMLLVVGVSNPN